MNLGEQTFINGKVFNARDEEESVGAFKVAGGKFRGQRRVSSTGLGTRAP